MYHSFPTYRETLKAWVLFKQPNMTWLDKINFDHVLPQNLPFWSPWISPNNTLKVIGNSLNLIVDPTYGRVFLVCLLYATGWFPWLLNSIRNEWTSGELLCECSVRALPHVISWSSLCVPSEQRSKTKVEQLMTLPQLSSKPHFTGGGFRINKPTQT